ncbi:hypothetical protein ACLBKU_13170 [Erythrobacter sp. NE805]|uniref:hypothetical protein n=1 Tax=Erythrobacter sp. NE805 TaxID=3389875 RepID=UPI00396B0885
MQNFDIVGALAFATIGIVLVLVILSWLRARKAQAQHKDAAVAQRERMEDTGTRADERAADSREGLPTDRVAPTDGGRSWSQERGANPPTPTTRTPPD